jgi:hypothetical protein
MNDAGAGPDDLPEQDRLPAVGGTDDASSGHSFQLDDDSLCTVDRQRVYILVRLLYFTFATPVLLDRQLSQECSHKHRKS